MHVAKRNGSCQIENCDDLRNMSSSPRKKQTSKREKKITIDTRLNHVTCFGNVRRDLHGTCHEQVKTCKERNSSWLEASIKYDFRRKATSIVMPNEQSNFKAIHVCVCVLELNCIAISMPCYFIIKQNQIFSP